MATKPKSEPVTPVTEGVEHAPEQPKKDIRFNGETLALLDRAIAERYNGNVELFNKRMQNLLRGTFDL